MTRNIQVNDYVFVTTKHQITEISDNQIRYKTDLGFNVATLDPKTGKYLANNGEVTGFEAAPLIIKPVAPIPIVVARPVIPIPVARPVMPMPAPRSPVRPAIPVPVAQPVIAMPAPRSPSSAITNLPMPTAQQTPDIVGIPMFVERDRPASEYPPETMRVGDKGNISGLGVMYNEAGEKARAFRSYNFVVLRVLRKGSNVVLRLDDDSDLTIRWRSEGTLGRGWFVRYKERGNVNRFYPVNVVRDV